MNKFRTLRYITYTLEIVLALVLQDTPGFMLEVFGGRPVLLIPVALTIAVFEPSCTASIWFGVVCGLLTDYTSSGAVGFFAILLAIMGYVVNIIMHDYIKANLLTTILISAVCVPVAICLHFLFFYIIPGYADAGYFFINHYLSRIIYTWAFVPVFFAVNRFLASKLVL